jgi:RNA polymerase sigma factor (sigma-70 family)
VIGLAAVPSIGRAASSELGGSLAEAEAVQRLYERHSRRIYSFCLYQLRKRDEAEEAVQTTFLYALGALRRGVVPAAESAWLLKIARNVCLSRFDAARRRGNVELVRDPQALAEIAPAREPDDADLLTLHEALARLPERQRRAILLREWQGLSYVEIAEELGLTTAAVETLLFRARRALVRELRGEQAGVRRRGLDLASLLGWAKSLLSGGAVKLAVGAAALAIVGAGASGPVEHRSRGGGGSSISRPGAAVGQSPATGIRAGPAPRAAGESLVHRRATHRSAEATSVARTTPHRGPAARSALPVTDPTPAAPAREPPAAGGAETSPRVDVPAPAPAPTPTPTTGAAELPSVSIPPTPSLPTVTIPAPPLSPPSLPGPPSVSPSSLPSAPSVPAIPDPPSAPALPSVDTSQSGVGTLL